MRFAWNRVFLAAIAVAGDRWVDLPGKSGVAEAICGTIVPCALFLE